MGHVLWEGLSPPLENVGALPPLCLETLLGWTIPPGLGWKVPLWVLGPCRRLISVAPARSSSEDPGWALPAQVLKGEGDHHGLQPVPDCPSSFSAELGAGSLRQRLLRKSPTLLLLSAPLTLIATLDTRPTGAPTVLNAAPKLEIEFLQDGDGPEWAEIQRERDSGSCPAEEWAVGWTSWVL